ncbi:hypothetical protein DFO67_11076 [Modicisalibacter xianhensis]|uniref:Vitamin K epoxide reductase domain-containing protein n=1 Tax=Modicisalibacter xianhensis TaxID=442341 RepID=A0A4R8FPJ2_9GAMM|nr:vitamin K epoxide reductase family protein [Halomonas xianhensis]TDX28376.1 hypothetical protein DFO67_11076 [Halomonas xianhensis]
MSINQVLRTAAGNPDPERLRHELQESGEPEIILRRAVNGVSVAGIAAMTAVTLFQSGIVTHLPDPPEQDFDSEKVNSSEEAYSYGSPDGPLGIANHAVNIVLATSGSANRAWEAPWLPVMATFAATPAALTSMQYLFYAMPVKEKA